MVKEKVGNLKKHLNFHERSIQEEEVKIFISRFSFYYGNRKIIEDISFPIRKKSITSIIGPSGCGKTSLLKAINRLHDENPSTRAVGSIYLDGENILSRGIDVILLRTRVGMVFQKPNPFPGSIYENVVFGPRLFGIKDKEKLNWICETSLRKAALWDEVKNKLRERAENLSGGQQQRLCIARTIALEPEVILMDEPCSALDPISTSKIEELMFSLKEYYTIAIVTHNMQQAARISDYVAFLYADDNKPARLIEFGKASRIFVNPRSSLTENYIAGKLG